MERPELTDAAALGGAAVVRATWGGRSDPELFEELVCWFGRGDPQARSFWARRLEDTATALADVSGPARFAAAERDIWSERVRLHLEQLPDGERERAVAELRALTRDGTG
ncbi:hypothetical protein [Streptomyces sp. JJ36]|uniref:hypothetical protein n=1 Tax=Streptomyces sp. JJ36 TaxID=2736645 RepID=UPI001F3ABB99|nr:hypothetical protein [Streptomyces sp. JJ36]MCF6526523.1 hypothetical protein [Streptomyces sp. JJ36]